MLWEDAFRLQDFAYLFVADAKLFELDVRDSTLTTPVFELVGLAQAELLPDQVVPFGVFGIRSQIAELLSLQNFLHGSREIGVSRPVPLVGRHAANTEGIWGQHGLFWIRCVFRVQMVPKVLVDPLNMVLKARQWRRRPLPYAKQLENSQNLPEGNAGKLSSVCLICVISAYTARTIVDMSCTSSFILKLF